MVLILHPNHLQAMQMQAEKSYPEECCGLLLGLQDSAGDRRWVYEHQAMVNDWTDDVAGITERDPQALRLSKRNRYWIDPRALMIAQRYGRDRGWIVLGVYHSHPDHPAVPSERDRLLAWPEYSYPILSLQQGRLIDCRSWRLGDDQQFYAEDLMLQA